MWHRGWQGRQTRRWTRPAGPALVEDCPPMELHEAIAGRAMVRSFSTEPVEPAVVDRILLDALRSPTAGNTGGHGVGGARGPRADTALLGGHHRRRLAKVQPGPVRRAVPGAGGPGGLCLGRALRGPLRRTRQVGLGLGEGAERWPVPYWMGDAAFGVMAVLLGAVDADLGACILGTFRGEERLAADLGVPPGWRPFCAVVLGHPDGNERRSPSLDRTLPPRPSRIHRGGW